MIEEFRAWVIDDDHIMRDSLTELLESGGFAVQSFSRADVVIEKLGLLPPDVMLCDVRMPGMSGIEFLHALKGETDVPLVLMSAHGDIPMAVNAIQDGAYSFLEKPFDPRRLLKILSNAAKLNRLSLDTIRLKERLSDLSGLDRVLLGNAKSIILLRQEIVDLSDSAANVMLLGETGTGKELVARALHDLGPRSAGPFIPINFATIPIALFEETLFGVKDKLEGLLDKADGGTLFLDDLGAIPLEIQAKLLRVIETKQFSRVGSAETRESNCRIVSAGMQNLGDSLPKGEFRDDLYFRLNTIILSLPALQDRREDIPLIYANFINQFAVTYEITPPEITSDDLTMLMSHDWPGNVRELRSVSERRILAARRGGGSMAAALQKDSDEDNTPENLRGAVAAFERQLIGKALATHLGKMDSVAEALGIGRRTLNEKIVKLGLNKDEILKI
jgi:DNA-binding NtrC family response regulator